MRLRLLLNSNYIKSRLKKGSFLYLFLFSLSLAVGIGTDAFACCSRTDIKINSQKEFNNLGNIILSRIEKGDNNIVVEFEKGRYYYKSQHIYWTDKHFPKTTIRIKGNGATLIASGNDIKINDSAIAYKKGSGFIDSKGEDFQNYSSMFHSDGLVEILNERTKECRVHCPELNNTERIECSNSYIRLTSWYTSFLYKVNRIYDGYVYFTADNLAKGLGNYGDYNVNYDFTVGKMLPRFRLINIPLGGCGIASTSDGIVNVSEESTIHQCEAGFFITMTNCEIKQLSIDGINILGCNADCYQLRFKGIKTESVIVSNSTFSASRGGAILAVGTDNITIKDCIFHDNYQSVIYLSNSCANATVTNNTFYNNGKGVVQSFCIVCRGGNYQISKNQIFNFNYGAIGVGVWYRDSEGSSPSFGVVEKNHIYYTAEYLDQKENWTLIDGGAIYLWSKNDGAVIRNNFIHDYSGMRSNRGIYCDDGTSNCTIYGNIILNMGSGYSIDLRYAPLLDGLNIGLRSNVNNRIYDNYYNNGFKFQGRIGDTTSLKGGNIILFNEADKLPANVQDNLLMESEDKIQIYDQRKLYRKGMRLVR